MTVRKPTSEPPSETEQKLAAERDIIRRRLNRFLMRRFQYLSEPIRREAWWRNTLTCSRGGVDLYMRIIPEETRDWPARSIILARIAFREERTGHGTAVVRLLADLLRPIRDVGAPRHSSAN